MGTVSSKEVAEGKNKESKENSEEEEDEAEARSFSQVTPKDRKGRRPSVSRTCLSFCRRKPNPDPVEKERRDMPEPPKVGMAMAIHHPVSSFNEDQLPVPVQKVAPRSKGNKHVKTENPREKHPSIAPQRSCESCADVPDSSHWVPVKPEVSTEKSISTYSLSSPAGNYECSESGLRWSCATPVSLQYRFSEQELFWTQLQMLQYQPAGPLMDIKLLSGELKGIHLPHSLCLAGSDPSVLGEAVRALHSDNSDTSISLETCKLTRFHASIPVGHFSLWQLVVRALGLAVRSHCEVLIYQSCPRPLILNTFLVPTPSTARKAVEKEWKGLGAHSILKPPPDDSLWVNSKFRLCTSCPSLVVKPSAMTLSYKTPPTYFQLCLENPPPNFSMDLVATGENQTVWEAVLWQGADYYLSYDQADSKESPDSNKDPVEFVDRHRAKLIQRVTSVMPIADEMLSKQLLNLEKYSKIRAITTNEEKMREIYDCLRSAGAKGKAAFYDALLQVEPFLVENLKAN